MRAALVALLLACTCSATVAQGQPDADDAKTAHEAAGRARGY